MQPINFCSIKVRDHAIHLSSSNFSEFAQVTPQPHFLEKGVDALCTEYWNAVDGALGKLDSSSDSSEEVQDFIDALVTRGATLRGKLLSEAMSEQLRGLAGTAPTLCLATNMPYVPWEALYFGHAQEGAFLGDLTVVVRMLEHERVGPRKFDRLQAEAERAVILMDPCLPADKKQLLKSPDFDVSETSTVYALAEKVKQARMILWICDNETDGKGLRIKKNLFYGSETAFSHLFPKDATLFLAACRAASGVVGADACIAGDIQFASGCTVIAPASVLRIDAGFVMMQRMARWLKSIKVGTTVRELWSELRTSEQRADTALEKALHRFFCVYGDIDHVLK